MESSLPRNNIDKGWAWFVLGGVYFGIAVLSTTMFMSGIMYITLLEYYAESPALTSIIGSLNLGLLCLLGPVVSTVINYTSCRTSIILGGLLLSLSYLSSVFVTSIPGLILTLGVLGGIGSCLTSVPFSVVLGYYFDQRRNIVISVSCAIIGFTMFIATPLGHVLLNTYGLKGAFMVNSGLCANICVCGVICKPSVIERRLQKQRNTLQLYDKTSIKKSSTSARQRTAFLSRICNTLGLDLCFNPSFMLFVLSTLTWNFVFSVCVMHLPNYLRTTGDNSNEIVAVMSAFSIANTAGRLLSALTVNDNKIDSLTLYFGSLGVAAITTLAFPLYSHFSGANYAFAAIVGFYLGAPNSLMTPITIRITGVDRLSTAHGLMYFFCGVGILIGPPIVGFLHEQSDTYDGSFILSGGLLLLGSFLALLTLSSQPTHVPEEKSLKEYSIEVISLVACHEESKCLNGTTGNIDPNA